jgi:hypothetical protein
MIRRVRSHALLGTTSCRSSGDNRPCHDGAQLWGGGSTRPYHDSALPLQRTSPRANGHSHCGAARRDAARHRLPRTQPGPRAIGRATAELLGCATGKRLCEADCGLGRLRHGVARCGASTSRLQEPLQNRIKPWAVSGLDERRYLGSVRDSVCMASNRLLSILTRRSRLMIPSGQMRISTKLFCLCRSGRSCCCILLTHIINRHGRQQGNSSVVFRPNSCVLVINEAPSGDSQGSSRSSGLVRLSQTTVSKTP